MTSSMTASSTWSGLARHSSQSIRWLAGPAGPFPVLPPRPAVAPQPGDWSQGSMISIPVPSKSDALRVASALSDSGRRPRSARRSQRLASRLVRGCWQWPHSVPQLRCRPVGPAEVAAAEQVSPDRGLQPRCIRTRPGESARTCSSKHSGRTGAAARRAAAVWLDRQHPGHGSGAVAESGPGAGDDARL